MSTSAVPGAAAQAANAEGMIEQITRLVGPIGVTTERARDLKGAARAIRALADEVGADEVLIPGELVRRVRPVMTTFEEAGLRWRVPESLEDARDAPLGVSLADGAIAETGSVILAERSLADRGIGLLSLTQVMLIPVSAIVPSLVEATAIVAAVARAGGYATFVTGPSRTADIEMSLTVGVQGPGRVHYVFVDALR